MSDETRLRILTLLLEGELCVCEIIAALDLPQSTVSRHLSYLRNNGWVKDRRQGNWMYYSVNADGSSIVKELQPLLRKHLGRQPEQATALDKLKSFQNDHENKPC